MCQDLGVCYNYICQFCTVIRKGGIIKYDFIDFVNHHSDLIIMNKNEFKLDADILDIYIDKIGDSCVKIVRMRVKYNFENLLNPNRNYIYTYFENDCYSWEQHGEWCTITLIADIYKICKVKLCPLYIDNYTLEEFQNRYYQLYDEQKTNDVFMKNYYIRIGIIAINLSIFINIYKYSPYWNFIFRISF